METIILAVIIAVIVGLLSGFVLFGGSPPAPAPKPAVAPAPAPRAVAAAEDKAPAAAEAAPKPRKKKKSKKKQSKGKAAASKPAVQTKTAPAAQPEEAAPASQQLSKSQRRKLRKKQKAEAESKAAAAAAASTATDGKQRKQAAQAKPPSAKQEAASLKADLNDGWEIVGSGRKGGNGGGSSSATNAKKGENQKTGGSGGGENKKAAEKKRPVSQQSKLVVEKRLHGKIIGKEAATLYAIQDMSGARVTIPRRDDDSSAILISGSSEAIGKAKSAIQELISKGYSRLLNPEIAEGAVKLDTSLHGRVVGPGGSVIKILKEKTGATIRIPDRSTGSELIRLSGTKQAVAAAKDAIKMIGKYGYSRMTNPGFTHGEVKVASDRIGLIIGKNGSQRKQLEGNTGAKINAPSRGRESDPIIIVGTKAAVDRCKAAILKLLAKAEEAKAAPAPSYEEYDQEPLDEDEEDLDPQAAQFLRPPQETDWPADGEEEDEVDAGDDDNEVSEI